MAITDAEIRRDFDDDIPLENMHPQPFQAAQFLRKAVDLMAERGKTYDAQGKQERSMAGTVAAFNAITGRNLTEHEGWLLMLLLKLRRQYQNDAFHRDSAEDAVAYSALLAEALARLEE